MADYDFDEDAYYEYKEDVCRSEGFYVSSDYGANKLMGGIARITEKNLDLYQKAEQAALFAVDNYNGKEKANLKFLRILNLNMEPVAGAMYYITLAARDQLSGEINHYQAKVWTKISTGHTLQIFRLAPYSPKISEISKDGVFCIGIHDLHPEMDENYLYHKCFFRAKELLRMEVVCAGQTGESQGYGLIWFKSRSAAERVFTAYYGKRMPNSGQCYDLEWPISHGGAAAYTTNGMSVNS